MLLKAAFKLLIAAIMRLILAALAAIAARSAANLAANELLIAACDSPKVFEMQAAFA